MKNRGKTDAIFILRQLQKVFLVACKPFCLAFIDLKKAFDKMPRKVIWWSMRKLEIDEWLVKIVQSMYKKVRSKVVSIATRLMFGWVSISMLIPATGAYCYSAYNRKWCMSCFDIFLSISSHWNMTLKIETGIISISWKLWTTIFLICCCLNVSK